MNGVWRWVLAALLTVTATACASGNDEPRASGATVPTEATTSTTLSVEQEVEQAYLKAFEIYVQAVRDLDTSRLAEAYAGTALETTVQEVEALREDGTPVRYEVDDHRRDVSVESPTRAVVAVTYRNHSVLLDISGKPIEADPDADVSFEYVLERRDGKWLVINVF